VREYADHALLKSSRYIAQPKRHATVGKCPKGKYKCSLLLVFEVHWDLVISRITIQKAIIFVPSQMLHHLINQWKWKIIFPGSRVQPTVVYTNSPSKLYTTWHQLVIIVLHYRQSGSLGHNMYWAHPLAIRDWIVDPNIKQFYHLCSNNLLHCWVEPSLWFPRWFGIPLKMYLMQNQ
jgi:hypothetical protein